MQQYYHHAADASKGKYLGVVSTWIRPEVVETVRNSWVKYRDPGVRELVAYGLGADQRLMAGLIRVSEGHSLYVHETSPPLVLNSREQLSPTHRDQELALGKICQIVGSLEATGNESSNVPPLATALTDLVRKAFHPDRSLFTDEFAGRAVLEYGGPPIRISDAVVITSPAEMRAYLRSR